MSLVSFFVIGLTVASGLLAFAEWVGKPIGWLATMCLALAVLLLVLVR